MERRGRDKAEAARQGKEDKASKERDRSLARKARDRNERAVLASATGFRREMANFRQSAARGGLSATVPPPTAGTRPPATAQSGGNGARGGASDPWIIWGGSEVPTAAASFDMGKVPQRVTWWPASQVPPRQNVERDQPVALLPPTARVLPSRSTSSRGFSRWSGREVGMANGKARHGGRKELARSKSVVEDRRPSPRFHRQSRGPGLELIALGGQNMMTFA